MVAKAGEGLLKWGGGGTWIDENTLWRLVAYGGTGTDSGRPMCLHDICKRQRALLLSWEDRGRGWRVSRVLFWTC